MAERRSQQTSVVFAAGSETHEGDCATVLMDETNNGCDWVQSVHRQCDDDATSYRCALCVQVSPVSKTRKYCIVICRPLEKKNQSAERPSLWSITVRTF